MSQLKRFFSPAVADAIMAAGDKSILAPHRREICYVFIDLRGFTAFTDSAEPEEVEAVLRDYQGAMGTIVTAHDGTLDRFAVTGSWSSSTIRCRSRNRASAQRPWRSRCRRVSRRCAAR
jgi:class 3 adenylate cyclase